MIGEPVHQTATPTRKSVSDTSLLASVNHVNWLSSPGMPSGSPPAVLLGSAPTRRSFFQRAKYFQPLIFLERGSFLHQPLRFGSVADGLRKIARVGHVPGSMVGVGEADVGPMKMFPHGGQRVGTKQVAENAHPTARCGGPAATTSAGGSEVVDAETSTCFVRGWAGAGVQTF
eukprot:CAMPEP_0179000922 /NCGR_PEP_ID=MMETSP0795-20121207/10997_1 /TAXON_ID=88552 /ORGANISM="Amoebophrya sp., Strain Ameob2" /LENGTH=172 /DNA_ID=CAMNT_0020694085 /DNA_START=129 /DNA_END=649 /DNA_ORIENTATION=+